MTTRLLVLLVLLTVLPAMGMLWLMNRAAAIETTAGQQHCCHARCRELLEIDDMASPPFMD
jgi:hypothetical protein